MATWSRWAVGLPCWLAGAVLLVHPLMRLVERVFVRPVAWLLGNEAWGLPDDLAAAADHRVAIPIRGRAESLNLATAAAVCLYATARHR